MEDFFKRLDIMSRIFAKVKRNPETGCLLWTGYTDDKGRGRIAIDGKQALAHRALWEAIHGPIGDREIFLLHSCDTYLCVAPWHLRTGTLLENNQDKTERGRNRSAQGAAHPNSKLTDDDVRRIRAYPSSYSDGRIAREFNVGRTLINNIRWGRVWKHVI